jgi:hypothetical protein
MEATELRIGNLVNYLIIDEMDERKKWFEVSEIDYDDLRIIQNKHEVNQDYQPIELTEEWLLKFGFILNSNRYYLGDIVYEFINYTISLTADDPYCSHEVKNKIKYVHELQNLYFALTNQELTI